MKRRSFFQLLLGSSIASRFLPYSIVAAEPSVASKDRPHRPQLGPSLYPLSPTHPMPSSLISMPRQ